MSPYVSLMDYCAFGLLKRALQSANPPRFMDSGKMWKLNGKQYPWTFYEKHLRISWKARYRVIIQKQSYRIEHLKISIHILNINKKARKSVKKGVNNLCDSQKMADPQMYKYNLKKSLTKIYINSKWKFYMAAILFYHNKPSNDIEEYNIIRIHQQKK